MYRLWGDVQLAPEFTENIQSLRKSEIILKRGAKSPLSGSKHLGLGAPWREVNAFECKNAEH